jgi:23S rRNA (guanosine2251-2'-O)-methyltransferase
MSRSKTKRGPNQRAPKESKDSFIVGRHPVAHELSSDSCRGLTLYLEESFKGDLVALAGAKRIPIEYHSQNRLRDLAGPGLPHQGAVLRCKPFVYQELQSIIEAGADLIVVLDGIEDPRNMGAISRAAFAFGAGALVIPSRSAAGPTASAHKTAAGALSELPVVRVENLRRTLEALKKEGYWIVGAEADGKEVPSDVDFKVPTVLIVGGEDRGLRRLTRESCDRVVAIPMSATQFSLNASSAASILLYEVMRQRI